MDAKSRNTPGSAAKTYKPFDLHGLKTYDLKTRPSKVFVEDLGRPVDAGASVADWLDSLPRQLGGNDLRRVSDHLCRAYEQGRTVVAALGGVCRAATLPPLRFSRCWA